MSERTLKPCPFCGGEADYVQRRSNNGNTWFVFAKCSICGAQSKAQFVNDILSAENAKDIEEKVLNRYDRVTNFWNRREKAEELR